MTKTRPLSTTSAFPSRPSTKLAQQESWSDSEDSMGYHVHYLPTSTVALPKHQPPHAPKPTTLEPTMTTISIGGILTKIPSNVVAKAASGTWTDPTKPKIEAEATKKKIIHVQGCNSPDDEYPEATACRGTNPWMLPDDFQKTKPRMPIMAITQSLINRGLYKDPNGQGPLGVLGTQPVTPPAPPKGEQGFATSRPWTDAEAMEGYAAPASKQHADKRGSYAACAAVSPAVVLASLSSPDEEVVSAEHTMQKYGRILHDLPGEEKLKVRALMESISELFPSSLGENKWHLSGVGALIGSCLPEYIADLYCYICSSPGYQTSAQRQALARRMREALFKCIPINGIAVVTEAVAALASVEELYDQDHGTRWAGKQITEEKLHRARLMMNQLHGQNHVKEVYEACGSHKDLAWINENIVYGLFLADQSILSAEETELVVLPALVSTGLKPAAEAQLKAALRLGMDVEEVEQIHRICEMLAGWKGMSLTSMRRAKDL